MTDEEGSDAYEVQEVLGFALVAAVETAAARKPGHRSLDHPSVAAEPL